MWTCEREGCETQFNRFPSYIKQGIKKYCTQSCATIVRLESQTLEFSQLVTKTCTRVFCRREFVVEKRHSRQAICGRCDEYPLLVEIRLPRGVRRHPHTGGYVMLKGIEHELSRSGLLLEHRYVLYEKIGPGTHPCHWCSKLLSWGGLEGICADHLDGDRLRNVPDNLVPSCVGCNINRDSARLSLKAVH